jgi:hypothetical protein
MKVNDNFNFNVKIEYKIQNKQEMLIFFRKKIEKNKLY